MKIISYNSKFINKAYRVEYRNPLYYEKPETGYGFFVSDNEKIIKDYESIGATNYEEWERVQRKKERQEEKVSWNELRKKAKELSGRPVRNREDAELIIKEQSDGEQLMASS